MNLVRDSRRARALEERLVWMLGCGRSGTTWLLNMLGQLPDVDGMNEPLIGAHLSIRISSVSNVEQADDKTVYSLRRGSPDYFFYEGRRDEWQPALRALLLAGLHGRRPDDPRTLLVLKEPNGSVAAPLIMSALPRSRLLFVIRDGRDVVDSALDAVSGGWVTKEYGAKVDSQRERAAFLVKSAQHWVDSIEAVHEAYEAHDPALRLRITYEDLRAHTADVLEQIATWMGRPVPRARAEEIASAAAFESVPADKRGPGMFVRAAQPGLWEERFDESEKAELERVMGPMLAEMGYSPAR